MVLGNPCERAIKPLKGVATHRLTTTVLKDSSFHLVCNVKLIMCRFYLDFYCLTPMVSSFLFSLLHHHHLSPFFSLFTPSPPDSRFYYLGLSHSTQIWLGNILIMVWLVVPWMLTFRSLYSILFKAKWAWAVRSSGCRENFSCPSRRRQMMRNEGKTLLIAKGVEARSVCSVSVQQWRPVVSERREQIRIIS